MTRHCWNWSCGDHMCNRAHSGARFTLALTLCLVAGLLVSIAAAHHRPGHGGGPGGPGGPSDPAPKVFDGCGTVVVDPYYCYLLEADSGGTYLVAGLHEYYPGARVHVNGEVDPFCVTFCWSQACIINATISDCPEYGETSTGSHDRYSLDNLRQMVAALGPCAESDACEWDLTGSGTVDVADLALMIYNMK